MKNDKIKNSCKSVNDVETKNVVLPIIIINIQWFGYVVFLMSC